MSSRTEHPAESGNTGTTDEVGNLSQPRTLRRGVPDELDPDAFPALRVALLHVTFGPYHVARAQALQKVDDLDVTFIELARSLRTHPWRNERDIPLVRLSDGEFYQHNALTLSRRARAALEDLDPDAVVSCGYGFGVMRAAARWARSKDRASILLHETGRGDRPRHWWKELVKRRVVTSLYDAVLCGGERHRDYIHDLGIPSEMIWTPYDVVDNDYYFAGASAVRTSPASWRNRLSLPDRPYFLYVGRFAPEKNLTRLLDAFARYARESDSPWPLVLVGDGPGRRNLMKRIDQLQVGGLVTVRPFAQPDQLVGYYGLAGCFILSSVSEPWGLVVNEAAAAGLPLLVSRHCGCSPELVKDGDNGFLMDPADEGQMAAALGRMAVSTAQDRAQMADRSQTLVSRLSLDAYSENLSNCIRKTVAKGSLP